MLLTFLQTVEFLQSLFSSIPTKSVKRDLLEFVERLLGELFIVNTLSIAFYDLKHYSKHCFSKIYLYFNPYRDISNPQNRIYRNAIIRCNGISDLTNGTIIQGSAFMGGQCPDIIIDLQSTIIQSLFKKCRMITNAASNVEIINRIQLLVASVVNYPKTDGVSGYEYLHPNWKRIAYKYILNNEGMPLSLNVMHNFGDCRATNALFCICLKAVGISNVKYGYFQVSINNCKPADHAMVLYSNVIKNEKYILDAYNPHFHGIKYHKLMGGLNGKQILLDDNRLRGLLLFHVWQKMKNIYEHHRRITRINEYPIILKMISNSALIDVNSNVKMNYNVLFYAFMIIAIVMAVIYSYFCDFTFSDDAYNDYVYASDHGQKRYLFYFAFFLFVASN